MSVALLTADEELGYWEYSVQTEDHGEWNLQFSRTVEAGPEHTDKPDMWRMHTNITWQGETFFSSWSYGEDYPFLTQHDMNGLIAAAAVATLAYWYTASARFRVVEAGKDVVAAILDMVGMSDEIEARVAAIDKATGAEVTDDEADLTNEKYYLKSEDLQRMGPHARALHEMYLELHHYGMATTTSEWRMATFDKDEIEPSWWGGETDEHQ